MISEQKQHKDFIIEPETLMILFPYISKKGAYNRLNYCKKKLKKPARSIVLASEYCSIKGITLDQLHNLL